MKIFMVVAALLLSGWLASSAQRQFPVTIKHQLGETTLQQHPVKIAALGPYILDLLLAMGVQPQGYAEVGGFIEVSAGGTITGSSIPYLGKQVRGNLTYLGSREQPSLEVLLAGKYDLIIGHDDLHRNLYPQLAKIAPTILLDGVDWRNRWQSSFAILGQALGRSNVAAQAKSAIEKRISSTRALLSAVVKKNPKALVIGFPGLSSSGTISTSNRSTLGGQLVQDLGFQVLVSKDSNEALSLEALPSLDPDLIFVVANSSNTTTKASKEWAENPILQSLRASKRGLVFISDNQLWGRIRGPSAAALILEEIRSKLTPLVGAR
jgi:iron complex transport system substrate-binding protein